jgi:hypothetical protein
MFESKVWRRICGHKKRTKEDGSADYMMGSIAICIHDVILLRRSIQKERDEMYMNAWEIKNSYTVTGKPAWYCNCRQEDNIKSVRASKI